MSSNTTRSKIAVSIEYAGLLLPVVKNDQGQDVTPLKPIVDLFGLQWDRQRKKITDTPYYVKFYGVCTMQLHCADGQKREQTCILLSRIAAYLMSLNATLVRAHGSDASADYLESKIQEWADALHDYEELGVAVNLNHARAQEYRDKQRLSLAKMVSIKSQAADPIDRDLITQIMRQMADEQGLRYQVDAFDEGNPAQGV